MTTSYLSEPLDHEGHARCVLAAYPGLYRYTGTHGWLMYTGTHWQAEGAEASLGRAIVQILRDRVEAFAAALKADPDGDKKLAAVRRVCAANSYTVGGIRQRMIDQVEVQCSIDDFDQHPFALNCANGVVDVRNGELAAHHRSQLFTYCLTVAFDPEAYCEEWTDFVDSVTESPQMSHYLQIVMGYCLTGVTREECMFYLYGPTRSGKGTFTETTSAVLGPLAEGLNFRTFTSDRTGDLQNFDLAPLKNKRLIVASESRRNERMNEAVIKQVTGGDKVWCANKGRPHFSYRPQYKIILTSNHPANVDPQDNAAWGRLRVMHFPHSHEGTENKSLKARLLERDALEAVLAWAVAGAIEWYRLGLPVMPEVASLTNQQRYESNTVALFVDNCCVREEGTFTAGTALYHAYSDWCKDEGYTPFGRKSFTVALVDLGFVTLRQRFEAKVQRGFGGLRFAGDGMGDATLGEVSQPHEVSRGTRLLLE